MLEKSDNEFWKECQQKGSYAQYLETYKDGLHAREAKEEVKKSEEKEENDYWALCSRAKVYSAYLKKYSKGLHSKEAINHIERRRNIGILSIISLVVFVVIIFIVVSN